MTFPDFHGKYTRLTCVLAAETNDQITSIMPELIAFCKARNVRIKLGTLRQFQPNNRPAETIYVNMGVRE